ncbi:hypothetical protein GTP58_03640 [Duganella sp. CY15W]|uniref:hypothetical protein n=1 Tax=Duganella sp. CY15W TaxID=2692172 RepID=UPI0013690D5E|nr:hypothetical protein [Duganella sp. CY15W]MYM27414.1 hypothetical protein [Duganella sp. CY15W]
MKTNVFSFLFMLVCAQVVAATSDAKIEIAGSGLKSIHPRSFSYPRIGTYLKDDIGTAAILVTAMPIIKYNPENDKEYLKYSYPVPPEAFSNGRLAGRLYKRSRTGNVGNWDGTWLTVNRGGTQLSVTVSFNGPVEKSRAVFELAQPFLDHLEWDETKLDSEVAFGARLRIPGMLPVKKMVGTLLYNKTGEPGNSSPNIMINATPLPRTITTAEFTQLCTNALTRTFSGKKHEGPYINVKNGVRVCDGWGSDMQGSIMYIGVASLPSGDVINSIGYVPDTMKDFKVTSLREAILNVQLLR